MTDRLNYAVFMDCPHATKPGVLWSVIVEAVNGGARATDSGHGLWVPALETWTLETLRMVLHELSAFLPAHDHAEGGVVAQWKRRGGPAPKVRRPREFNHRTCRLYVRARGWQAEVWTWQNERSCAPGELPASAGDWSDPMAASLVDLAARSPFTLEGIARVQSGDPVEADVWPSRLGVQLGEDPPWDPCEKAYDYDAMNITRRVRDRLEDGR